ncbi:MAG: hypothetical protein IPO48_07170 [Saprospiraceae bacterium]|nr:hypothetical protein [Saprospiraceae bacterium]
MLTGKSTASEEKTMNVELKEEFKKGGFGKVTVGGGSMSRGDLKGNYNKFDSKNQISFVGIANTGRNGLSWDDYQDLWVLKVGMTIVIMIMVLVVDLCDILIIIKFQSGKVRSVTLFSGNMDRFPTNIIGGKL